MLTGSKSSVVIVAGTYLDQLQPVLDKVDSIGQEMLKLPLAIVLIVPGYYIRLNTTRHYASPPVIELDISTYTPGNYSRGTYFQFTCRGQGDRSTELLLRHGVVQHVPLEHAVMEKEWCQQCKSNINSIIFYYNDI